MVDLLPPGTPIDLDNCVREPIRTPGAVQGHGVLLAATGDGVVVQASENAGMLFADPVLGRPLEELVGAEAIAALRERAGSGVPNLRPWRSRVGDRAVDLFGYGDGGDGLVVEIEPIAADDPGDSAGFQDDVADAVVSLQDAATVTAVLERAVAAVRALAGFDRVWAYRFEPDEHGVIVAEDRDPEVPSFLGLHYPASDIPPQARALFLVNRVRLIADVHGEPSGIDPVVNPGTGEWLDLSAGVLRAVSPIHIAYLRNMGATASMSIALTVRGRLWGLLSAHHYAGPKLLSQRTRVACELLGLVCSVQVSTAEELERSQRQVELAEHRNDLLERVVEAASVTEGLVSAEAALLGVCAADGAAVRVGSVLRTCGRTPPEADILALMDGLPGQTWSTDALDPVIDGVAGVLATPLSLRTGNHLVWFRDEWAHTLQWGGKEAAGREDGTTLNPKASWREWAESVSGRSRPWSAEEVASVTELRSGLGTFLLGRAEQLAELNAELERSNAELDAFAYVIAHDLREPLRGIHNFTSFTLEDHGAALPEEGHENLGVVRRLAERTYALLDSLLEYSRVGKAELVTADTTLGALVADLREMLHSRLSQPGVTLAVSGEETVLHGDYDGLLHVLANLVSNAIKYNENDERRVEIDICTLADTRRGARPDELAGDAEPVVLRVRDNGIGIPAEHLETVFAVFRRLHGRDEFGGGTGAGLTIARRIAERHGGELWIDATAPGEGTTFCISLAAG